MDVAASEFYREGKYDLDFKSPPDSSRHISADELSEIYQGFVNDYPGKEFALGLCSVYILYLTGPVNVDLGQGQIPSIPIVHSKMRETVMIDDQRSS